MNTATKDQRIQSARSPTDSRILQLLGAGAPNSVVASAVGVTESYISQLISKEDFRSELQELKFNALQSHNARDAKYDSLEDKLVKQFEDNLVLIQNPMQALKALQVVNGLKRRGTSAPEAVTEQQNIVTLLIPQKIVQQFTTNINNQVVTIGDQTLQTMQSSALLNTLENKKQQRLQSKVGELLGPTIDMESFSQLGTPHEIPRSTNQQGSNPGKTSSSE